MMIMMNTPLSGTFKLRIYSYIYIYMYGHTLQPKVKHVGE